MTQIVGSIVAGAGVVGIAIARALALRGHEPLLLDGEDRFGSWTSSRNSEVIHAGLYYPPESLKSRLCVKGKHKLYAFCEARGVPHRRCGKLVFASEAEQLRELKAILATGKAAGVQDLALLDGRDAKTIEPDLDCAFALYSGSTGIVDSHALMMAMLGDMEAHGGMLVTRSRIARVSRSNDLWQVYLDGETAPVVASPIFVNSAGLRAHCLAASIEQLKPEHVPQVHYAKGSYFVYSGRVPFNRLIYPLPEPGGLGVHLTFDIGGQARFGPDVEWIDDIDYLVESSKHQDFVKAAQRIWSALDPVELRPGYAGIRPRLGDATTPFSDFRVDGPAEHGCAGLVNLFGIESPGLTASLALAGHVLEKLD